MSIRENVDKANLKWDNMPTSWLDGAYVGNGMVGTIFWKDECGNLFFEIGRCDFYDHRNHPYPLLQRNNRLNLGNFTVSMDCDKLSGNLELDLYTACVKGTINTSKSVANLRVFACDNADVLVFEFEKVNGACDINITYNPYTCESPRGIGKPENYLAYPPASFGVKDDVCLSLQSLPEDEIYNNVGKGNSELCLAWYREDKDSFVRFYVTVHYSYPEKFAQNKALENIAFAREQGIDNLFKVHCDFWNEFYSKSASITLEDKRIGNYYYLQLYRFASATRSDGQVLDLMGPWYKKTPWPAIWWNLNQQSTYSSICGTNHPEMYYPLIDFLYNNKENMAQNCNLSRDDVYALDRACGLSCDETNDVQNEFGNLGYMLYYVWEMYRTVMDDDLLEQKILPLMIGAFKYLLTKTYVGDDNKIHFVPSASPEYTWAYVESGVVDDCSFTISVTKWLAKTIISCCERLAKQDEVLKDCRNLLENVIDYPQDDSGIMIGKDMPFAKSHRHWSHIFMLYPFCEFTFEDEKMKPVLLKSLETWLKDRYCFSGFAYAGAASIYSMLGEGNTCYQFLNDYFDNCNPKMYHCCSNGMYCEGTGAVIETPFAIMRSLQDMLLSSYNDVIRILPAIPDAWDNVEFENMRTQGAFLVSAKCNNGNINFVKIQSLAGEKCIVKLENISKYKVDKEIVLLENNVAEIKIKKDESCTFVL